MARRKKDEVSSGISAILLAAGESRRMGRMKQLLPFGSSTVIETCISNLLSSKASEIIVVLGHRADEIIPLIEKYPVRVILNPEYTTGMSSSIIAGVQAANMAATGFLFALVDQPLISSKIIDSVIDSFCSTAGKKSIVIPKFNGKGGHPMLVDSSFRAEVVAINPTVGLKQVKQNHSDAVIYLPVDDPSVVEDMDYFEDYQRQLSRSSELKL